MLRTINRINFRTRVQDRHYNDFRASDEFVGSDYTQIRIESLRDKYIKSLTNEYTFDCKGCS
jgi:hypothetical protein